ncbi:MAG: hypothetical protein VB081_08170 [Christensenella sp.]|uniref:hypothetical protein n=1 Tax=Christensenella sp. TaxID=1935934 RepID=UPI002B208A82|nr:hypothetical protein [Christensenella sp.]MEA5003460.1 hypothetical protein [Christensenella sp.]
MKKYTKWLAAFLAAIMMIGAASPALAAAAPNQKEEVVYAIANGNGAVNGVYVVNSFSGGDITDYGVYTEVRMLTSETPIIKNSDTITFSDQAEKVYYEGIMDASTPIPWNISIRYFLEGKEYSPKEIAGKSGKLEVWFQITKNEACTGTFFEDYALQATFLLDANKCTNITAKEATIANVGSDKQLAYTILPGKGIDTVITADVKDFEMDAVTINGIRLNMDVDIDDQELMEEIGKLIDGTVELNDGAISLADSALALRGGGSGLTKGSASLKNGADSLDRGLNDLQAGVTAMQDGFNQLNAQSGALLDGSSQMKEALSQIQGALQSVSVSQEQITALAESSAAIKTGINSLSGGASGLQDALGYVQYKDAMAANGLDIDALKAGNAQAVSNLETQISSLRSMIDSLDETDPAQAAQAEQLRSQIDQLETVVTLLQGNNAAIGGTASYLNGISGAAGSLQAGLTDLQENYDSFDAAISELTETLSGMLSKLAELSSGINKLAAEYSKLDRGLQEYSDGVAQLSAGYTQIMSGVSALSEGSKELQEGSGVLYAGTQTLYDGLTALCKGASALAEGTGEMREQSDGMDGKAEEKIDEVLASIGSGDTTPISFASDKNTNVSSVQFAIRTDAISVQEENKADPAPKEESTFWQKFLQLFGIE